MYICVHKQLREKVTELGHLEMREYMKALGRGRIERSETGSGARRSRIQILVVPLTLWLLTSHMTSLIHSLNTYLSKTSRPSIVSHANDAVVKTKASPYPDVTRKGDKS